MEGRLRLWASERFSWYSNCSSMTQRGWQLFHIFLDDFFWMWLLGPSYRKRRINSLPIIWKLNSCNLGSLDIAFQLQVGLWLICCSCCHWLAQLDSFGKSGMAVGLGIGRASCMAIVDIGEKLRDDSLRDIICVPMWVLLSLTRNS